ncbi:MAG: CYTH domain-containing protein [Bacteroidales bacterium]|nr:CYTH domain-containing protein [Bacteroidales bacterium]MBP5214018.1 CYTH domain-containing protein [Bacteroidales bacterium]MBP5763920.1 CYTH domain-containing protein [Bacteroidales bacterium]
MGKEIERKFLVKSDRFKAEAIKVTSYHQGYIPTLNGMTVRIRIAGDAAYITLKDHAIGFTRHEFEYPIPKTDAVQLLELMCAKPQIAKTRYVVPATQTLPADQQTPGLKWEVDVFEGDNEGLTVAEIEVPSEDTPFERPEWLGEEVTGDKRYYNSHLCSHPFRMWK